MTNTIAKRGSQAISSAPGKSLPIISEDTTRALKTASQVGMSLYAKGSNDDIVAALDLAASIQQLRDIFDFPEIRARIESLCDTPLGFRTDRDPKIKRYNKKTNSYEYPAPYEYMIVRDAAIEAVLRGLQLAGNQFNIIAGRFYVTKEGFEYLIKRLSYVTEYRPIFGVPIAKNGGAIVNCEATWNQHGRQQSLSAEVPIKTSESGSADQYIGKAKRKFYERCYSAMTGNSMPEGDASDVIDITPKASQSLSQVASPSVSPAIAAAAAPIATLSEQQIKILETAIKRQLTPVGQAAFRIDMCGAFNCNQLSEIPADQHSTIMGWLSNEIHREQWNQGCACGDSTQLLTPEEIAKLSPTPQATEVAAPSDETEGVENEDDLQGQLV